MKTFLISMMVWFIVMASGVMLAHCAEPTTIIRRPGKVGERVEVVGKGAKENAVNVRVARVVNGEVVQERIVVKGSDVFDAKPKPERKVMAKEKPQPASVKPVKAKVGK